MESVGTLLCTGVPGWLTEALLTSLRAEELPGLRALRCLVQPGVGVDRARLEALCGRNVELYTGDLRDEAALAKATAGADTVLHAAGLLHVRRIREFYEVNTEGTRRLAEAAMKSGVSRFVFVSSNAAAGRSGDRSRVLSEEDIAHPLSHYGKSKLLAERALWSLPGPMERVVLRPCMFYGPPVPIRHVRVYRHLASRRPMPLVGGGDHARSVTYLGNLVQASRLALLHPNARGQTYFVADATVHTTKRIVDAMAVALGVRPRYLPLPTAIARAAHTADQLLSAADRYWTELHLFGEADWNVGVSSEKARRELGYRPVDDLEGGMREAVAWCRARGLL